MFNGIIKNTGRIKNIYKKNNNCKLEILSNMSFKRDEIGSSISCSGTCLTLEKFKKNLSQFYISAETLKKTNFKLLKKGDKINLEKSLKYGNRISGHFLQGHVDTTCVVKKITILGKSWMVDFNLAKKYKRYLVEKGSIGINGVSLTITKIQTNIFQVSIIPQTLKFTNLINLRLNEHVNIEFDILSKYIKNFIK